MDKAPLEMSFTGWLRAIQIKKVLSKRYSISIDEFKKRMTFIIEINGLSRNAFMVQTPADWENEKQKHKNGLGIIIDNEYWIDPTPLLKT